MRSGWRSSILIASMLAVRRTLLPVLLALPALLVAQQQQPPTHDITMVDKVPLGGAMATPLPEAQRKQLEKYDLPELAGSSQALGSQLINGELRQPLVDYFAESLRQRGFRVATGRFGAMMEVELTNHGPVTFVLATEPWS